MALQSLSLVLRVLDGWGTIRGRTHRSERHIRPFVGGHRLAGIGVENAVDELSLNAAWMLMRLHCILSLTVWLRLRLRLRLRLHLYLWPWLWL